jgi:hypothetical protein
VGPLLLTAGDKYEFASDGENLLLRASSTRPVDWQAFSRGNADRQQPFNGVVELLTYAAGHGIA